MEKFLTIDEYINAQPEDKQAILEQFRNIIKKAAPRATEVISYGMPAFKQNSVLVYFAAAKDHYGFYPTPKSIEVFKKELASYKTSKGAIQFPANKPLPVKLITDIVNFRIADDAEKTSLKESIKKTQKKNN